MRLRDWKTKAYAQAFFARLPAGHRVNMVFQRATGGVPISDASLARSRELAEHHMAAVERHIELDGEITFFEFGAGFDLHMPLLLRSCGAGRQLVVDIRPLARPELVRDIVDRLHGQLTSGELVGGLPRWGDESLESYLESIGVRYRAPADARATGLPAGSIGVVTSTNTLEHIPAADIAAIYRECRRIIEPAGVLSFQIDYSDHYSHFDKSISPYNFLQFDEGQWHRYNNSLHFQNRLRHADHLALVEAAGFEIVECETTTGTDEQRAALEQLDLAPPFDGRAADDLAILGSRMVLRPGGTAATG